MLFPKLFIVCAILVLLSTIVGAFASNGADAAALAIARAEDNVSSAYQAVKDAEGAGANISGLLSKLNEAGKLLAKANISCRTGNFENATLFADASTEIANSIKIEAYRTRDLASYQGLLRFQFTFAASILSIAAVLFISFTSWRLFKRYYCKRILKLKPEMSSGEP